MTIVKEFPSTHSSNIPSIGMVQNLMSDTHQHSFDFPKPTTSVMSVKACRSISDFAEPVQTEIEATLIGDSLTMQRLRAAIRTLATSSEPVLITGETGNGKELIARAIHDLSPRTSGCYERKRGKAGPSDSANRKRTLQRTARGPALLQMIHHSCLERRRR